jgi:hypothetical protein
MATYALVPGGGGDPWEWHRRVPELEARGHEAFAVRLPAEDDTVGWSEYADAVVEILGNRDEVTVVAASMGGFTAPTHAPGIVELSSGERHDPVLTRPSVRGSNGPDWPIASTTRASG